MSVDQLPPGKVRAAQRDAQLVRYDEYIDTQIASTRRLVKAVDITSVLMTMVVGTLAFLLVAAVVEHWLVPGGYSLLTRTILFAALVSAVGYYAIRRLGPLIFRPINPVYAAHTIEQGSPSLKNSLLNLLLFRQQPDEITDAVYETLEQQAAQRLVRVPVEAAVDRTSLLRLGYVLVGVVALCALYKILSPKDPLITAGRVLMPWSEIVPASRVSITNIEPGSTTLARGDVLKLSAEVKGIGDDDPVVVRYTTTDGQAVDKTVELWPTAAGLRFIGQLPAASPGAPQGVAQNLRYRIEAGDARSRDFTVTVVEAPTITVERIDYNYPDYTGFADRSVTGLGDIRAIEGTEVTIHARANEPIEEATVDFEADGRHDLVMTVNETQARTPLVLAFREDRELPKFTSYVLRFTTQDGRKNRDPVKFAIDVLPDYEPEVRLTAPREKTRDVRVDEAIAIEVEARDPDFALHEVRLQGDSAGSTVLDKQLLAAEHTGRYSGRYLFTPREHNLKPGDTMRYWVAARDNRSPQMSPTTSEPQTLRITAPDPNRPQPPQDRIAQRDKPQQQNQGEQGEDGESGGASNSADGNQQQPGESASADGQSGNQQNTARAPQNDPNNNQNNGEQSEQQSGDPSENQSGEQSGEQSGPQSGEQSGNQSGNQSGEQSGSQSANGESNGDNNSGGQSSGGQQGEQSNDGQSQPGNAGQRGGQNGRGTQQGSSGEQSGEQSSNSQPSNGEPQDGTANDPSGNAQRQPRDGQGQQRGERQRNAGENGESESSEESPVSPDGDNDGEAFERIQKFLDRQKQSGSQNNQQQSARDGQQNANDANETGDSNTDNAQPGESASADGQQGKQPGADTRPGDHPQESEKPGETSNESKSPGGQQTASKGESGAGDSPQDEQGSPDSQPNMKPGEERQQRPSGESQSPDQEPPSGGRGKRESDSQGGQGGDRAGGGEEGGGQKANREGTGSSGQNQSADEGAGESSEQGGGNNSPNAGEDATSSERTGQPGRDQRGEGSSQRDGEGDQQGGKKPGEQPGAQNGGRPSAKPDGARAPARPGEQGSNQQPGEPASAGGESGDTHDANEQSPDDQNAPQHQGDAAQGTPTGDGSGTPQGAGPPRKTDGTAPEADAANLEYAQKQTDLVLESLDEQMRRKKVDKRLLDELGWTDDDLKKFLERWQQLKQSARGDGPAGDAARRELDDALRSLGLRPGTLRQSNAPDDAVRDLQQGYRGSVPLEYQERLRAYNQGVSRARPDDE